MNLIVVSGGYVNLGSGVTHFYNPNNRTQISYEKGISGTYYAGTYTLATQNIAAQHQEGQGLNTSFRGDIDVGYGAADWQWEQGFHLPAMDSATSITAFNGDKLKGDLNVTFTPKTGYTYKLKLQLNGDETAIDTFDSYTSGKNVRLSSETVAYIQSKNKNDTIPLKATLLSYKNGTLIGSKSVTHSVSNVKGLHLMLNGSLKEVMLYVRVNGQWKETTPYIRTNSQWKEGI